MPEVIFYRAVQSFTAYGGDKVVEGQLFCVVDIFDLPVTPSDDTQGSFDDYWQKVELEVKFGKDARGD